MPQLSPHNLSIISLALYINLLLFFLTIPLSNLKMNFPRVHTRTGKEFKNYMYRYL